MKARKRKENNADQIVKDFERKKEINYSDDQRVQEMAPEGEEEEDPEVQQDNDDQDEQLEEQMRQAQQ